MNTDNPFKFLNENNTYLLGSFHDLFNYLSDTLFTSNLFKSLKSVKIIQVVCNSRFSPIQAEQSLISYLSVFYVHAHTCTTCSTSPRT